MFLLWKVFINSNDYINYTKCFWRVTGCAWTEVLRLFNGKQIYHNNEKHRITIQSLNQK